MTTSVKMRLLKTTVLFSVKKNVLFQKDCYYITLLLCSIVIKYKNKFSKRESELNSKQIFAITIVSLLNEVLLFNHCTVYLDFTGVTVARSRTLRS